MTEALVINEIYASLQGESTFSGLPCIFIRLTGCDLRCSYCDTAYAFKEGRRITLDEILGKVLQLAAPYVNGRHRPRLPLVELTGGEPLLQRNSLVLMERLSDQGFTVLLETSGAHDIKFVDQRVHRIVDLKCPSSGECSRNRWDNLKYLSTSDEIKLVISSVEDYEWAKQKINEYQLPSICQVLLSWAAPLSVHQRDPSLQEFPSDHQLISRRDLAERIIKDALTVRFQAQLHKVIWHPDARGV